MPANAPDSLAIRGIFSEFDAYYKGRRKRTRIFVGHSNGLFVAIAEFFEYNDYCPWKTARVCLRNPM